MPLSLSRAGEPKGDFKSLRKQQEPFHVSIQNGKECSFSKDILTVTKWENISNFRDTIESEIRKENKTPTAQ